MTLTKADMAAWRKVVEQVVSALADEEMQRRAWFGLGPEQDSPNEMFNQFFGDAAIPEFLRREDTGLNERQRELGSQLVQLMTKLSADTPNHIEPGDLIDDPRFRRLREAAATFLDSLSQT
jgi:glycerol-3-phosphate O-acyltransferase